MTVLLLLPLGEATGVDETVCVKLDASSGEMVSLDVRVMAPEDGSWTVVVTGTISVSVIVMV